MNRSGNKKSGVYNKSVVYVRASVLISLFLGLSVVLVFFPEGASGEALSQAILKTGSSKGLTMGVFSASLVGLLSSWFQRNYRRGKRGIDLVAASVGLILSAPIVAIAAILIKLDSPGPVFYRQKRLGKDATPFNIYKLRTMNNEAEQFSGPVWAGDDDPRITRIGRFLRKRRIDELPQFFNVLRGDMSLVGPRPERPFFSQQISEVNPGFSKRLHVRPGITGLAQVRFRYSASILDSRRKLRYDLLYCRRTCLMLDMRILFATIICVFKGVGAR